MSPQFVDFDADGHVDIVCAIFDGSPRVARGDGAHWRQPETLLDQDGARIIGNVYWDHDDKRWVETHRCDPEGGVPELDGKPAMAHVTSAIAVDWDRDGDLDLVMGEHRHGHVYLRRNLGSAAQPRFASRNELVRAGGEPIRDPGTVATVRAVDWDGDGRLDLMVSGMGDPYARETGGGVAVYLDQGEGDETELGRRIELIAPSPKGAELAPTRPDVGLHPEPVDFDGDGDLDLIVGGYSMWTPELPSLDATQQQQLAALRAERERLNEDMARRNKAMLKAQQGLDREAARNKRLELAKDPARRAVLSRLAELHREIEALAPRDRRVSFVWFYENLGGR